MVNQKELTFTYQNTYTNCSRWEEIWLSSENRKRNTQKGKKSYTKWDHLETTLTFCPFSSSSQLLCCFRSSNHTNNPNPTFSLLLQKQSQKHDPPPPFCQVKNLKISQSLVLSITHSLTHVLTHKCFLMSHTSSARWCFLWNKAKIQTWRGSFHHYCQYCQQLTTTARKDNRKKKKRRSSTHTHTHKERWFLIQRILHKKSVFFLIITRCFTPILKSFTETLVYGN